MKYMTKELYKQCPSFGQAMDEYLKEYEKTFPCPPPFMETIDCLHDCDLVSAGIVGDDYVIVTENIEWGEDGYTKIVLKNMSLIKQDFDKQSLGWCYDELYRVERGYELHVLFYEYGSSEMYELTVECEDIEIIDIQE